MDHAGKIILGVIMKSKQINIFGFEEVDKKSNKSKKQLTMKEKFRQRHGYKDGFLCKNCVHFKEYFYHSRHYFKCELLGETNSTASDVRKKDVACRLYKEKE